MLLHRQPVPPVITLENGATTLARSTTNWLGRNKVPFHERDSFSSLIRRKRHGRSPAFAFIHRKMARMFLPAFTSRFQLVKHTSGQTLTCHLRVRFGRLPSHREQVIDVLYSSIIRSLHRPRKRLRSCFVGVLAWPRELCAKLASPRATIVRAFPFVIRCTMTSHIFSLAMWLFHRKRSHRCVP